MKAEPKNLKHVGWTIAMRPADKWIPLMFFHNRTRSDVIKDYNCGNNYKREQQRGDVMLVKVFVEMSE